MLEQSGKEDEGEEEISIARLQSMRKAPLAKTGPKGKTTTTSLEKVEKNKEP